MRICVNLKYDNELGETERVLQLDTDYPKDVVEAIWAHLMQTFIILLTERIEVTDDEML